MDLQQLILQMAQMVRELLAVVHYWWKLPIVLMLFCQFQQRDYLNKNKLFDTYPANVNKGPRQKCQDPVIGFISLGCYHYNSADWPHLLQQGRINTEDCVTHCKDLNYTHAGHTRNDKCLCSDALIVSRGHNHHTKRHCTSKSRVEVYRTMHCSNRMKSARSPDGTCNSLENPAMGSRLYRFGRNVPLNETFESQYILDPNPREISRKLLERKQFIPVKQLNLLAAGFIQFVLHDWFDHGTPNSRRHIIVPLKSDDPERKRHHHLKIARTRSNNCQQDSAKPSTFQNDVTHWWDGSQIYGSDEETSQRLRSFKDGKLRMDRDNLLPVDRRTGIDITGFNQNWWVGLSLLHNVFAREHNNICKMLKKNFPDWSDDKLYDTARLINTAVIIKIHTVEWTPAILNNTALTAGVRVNFGLSPGKEVLDWLRHHNISASGDLFKPVVGNPREFHGVPFSLTEEFVSVYRMHSLLPDELHMRSGKTYSRTGRKLSLPEYCFRNARRILRAGEIADVVYTFGTEHPGALTLHNFPRHLVKFKLPSHQQDGKTIDLASIDVIRDRERGIPRYNKMRRLLNLKPVESFDKLTPNKDHVTILKQVYDDDIEKLDLLVGSLAEEPRPDGYGFGETPFTLFLMMATRRLATDRFMTDDYKADIYSPEGMAWIQEATMCKVLIRAFPEMPQLSSILREHENAFFPWD